LLALGCGGGGRGAVCHQLQDDLCACWVHPTDPPSQDDIVIKDCGPESVATTGALPNEVCCADPGYPSSGQCTCSSFDALETADGYCSSTFGGIVVPRCASGGKLVTSAP